MFTYPPPPCGPADTASHIARHARSALHEQEYRFIESKGALGGRQQNGGAHANGQDVFVRGTVRRPGLR